MNIEDCRKRVAIPREVYRKKYYQQNKERIKEYFQRPEVKKKQKEYYKEHQKKYYQKLEVKERLREYQKNKRKINKSFYIACLLRNALKQSFKSYSTTVKQYSSKKYGIDWTAIIEHLKPFPKDIENYHVDHIIPLSRFDFNNAKHIKIAFAPENHQWLIKEENLWKHNKLIMPHTS